VCFLSGCKAVVGDRVLWEEAPGSGGKLISVQERDTALRRVHANGKEQVLAANLAGLIVVFATHAPALQPQLLDRYLTIASHEGLDVRVCLNKTDTGVPDAILDELAIRQQLGVEVVHTSALSEDGVTSLRTALATPNGPWAFVGQSGVGKTSLIARLLPDVDVGPVGELTTDGQHGAHTTAWTRLFTLPGGGEIIDSPGIRNLTPSGLTSQTLKEHFPGLGELRCEFRNCLHRVGEQGCAAPGTIHPQLLASYYNLLAELERHQPRYR